jgi:NhaP-type Na+/H+ or K+/H+ antiporter
MRGVVSLAAALAVPLALPGGAPFPARDAIVIVTLVVIVLTLLGHGLTLPWLIRSLRLGTDVGVREEEARARQRLVEAAMHRLEELYPVWPGHRPLLDQLRETYRHRSQHVERQITPASVDGEDRELIEHREIRRTIIDAEREALLRVTSSASWTSRSAGWTPDASRVSKGIKRTHQAIHCSEGAETLACLVYDSSAPGPRAGPRGRRADMADVRGRNRPARRAGDTGS